jgi:hypothetical protein
MGVDHFRYVGPFIKTTCKLEFPITEQNICNNINCSNHNKEQSTKFCPECGNSIQTKSITGKSKEPVIDSWELTEEKLNDLLTTLPSMNETGHEENNQWIDVLIPNVFFTDPITGDKIDYNRFGYDNEYNDIIYEHQANIPHDDMLRLRQQFSNEISILEEQYDKIEIAWGLLQSWH